VSWPTTEAELVEEQEVLGQVEPDRCELPTNPVVAGCFACLPRGLAGAGEAGDPVWAAAAAYRSHRRAGRASVTGTAAGPYRPGLLALRIGAPLAEVLTRLPHRPDVVLIDATGRDHPRRAGLAFHLGSELAIPTVGVTHRPLLAAGPWPVLERGATSALLLDNAVVGYWICTRDGQRPIAVHAAWQTDPDMAVALVMAVTAHRTPAPLREARRLARTLRASRGNARSSLG
jgi:deoxyribonuclease V